MWQQFKNIYHLTWAIIANMVYGYPSQKLFTIGITGTDGKTTTALIINHILKNADKKTVVISTLGASINGKEFNTGLHVTTPSSIGIQRFLKQAVKEGCTHAVLEVSSHALDQYRAWGINFDIGVLTNISHEHLDYHKTMKRYTKAKLKLLKNAKTVILNYDDKSYGDVVPELHNKKIFTYSLENQEADITLGKFPFTTQLKGDYNLQNSLAAVAAAAATGITPDVITQSLSSFQRPKGRLDVVYDKEFQIIIDFAVTPNAFTNLLSEVKKTTIGRIIHVFGLSGKRDKEKRPIAGSASARFADLIILTADDPRDEKVQDISDQIARGIHGFTMTDASHYSPQPDHKKLMFEIDDRQDAINFAIELALPGDLVVLTGKAHEQSMAYAEGERPWDEYRAVEDALKKKDVTP